MSKVDSIRQKVLADRTILCFETQIPDPYRTLVSEGLLVEYPKHRGRYVFAPTKELRQSQFTGANQS